MQQHPDGAAVSQFFSLDNGIVLCSEANSFSVASSTHSSSGSDVQGQPSTTEDYVCTGDPERTMDKVNDSSQRQNASSTNVPWSTDASPKVLFPL